MSSKPLPQFEINKDLWFDDGDIYICARRFDSGALRLYKLHRDLLAARACTLLEHLDASLPSSYTHPGKTPYAYLPDDDALDLERFFIALCYPIYTYFSTLDNQRFSTALPVFNIALKYAAYDVIEDLASQLEHEWPLTMEEWDAAHSMDGPFVEAHGDAAGAADVLTETVSAIRVAHIANMPGLLSAAYYHLARLGLDALWRYIVSHVGPTEERQLTRDDVRRVTFGRMQLSKYMLAFKQRLPRELGLHPRCGDAWHRSAFVQSEDPLADLAELCSIKGFPGERVCWHCRFLINMRGKEERETVWAMLPQLLCIPVHLDPDTR